MELKTLKDIIIEKTNQQCSGAAFVSKKSGMGVSFANLTEEEKEEVIKGNLELDRRRQEAIKWIKEIKKYQKLNKQYLELINERDKKITILMNTEHLDRRIATTKINKDGKYDLKLREINTKQDNLLKQLHFERFIEDFGDDSTASVLGYVMGWIKYFFNIKDEDLR